jgi:hypothetical protein
LKEEENIENQKEEIGEEEEIEQGVFCLFEQSSLCLPFDVNICAKFLNPLHRKELL